ncbi:hypothetical protein CHELA1G2_11265 [Hyphomicrobiales bacterium]|nr:hypothetical protein CHELA1G2_11265 [Hyphomicrobiales bacterium]
MICKRCQKNTVKCAGSILAPTSIQCTACGWRPGDDPLKVDAEPQVVSAATDTPANPIQYVAVGAGDILSNQANMSQSQLQQILADIQKRNAGSWGMGGAG